jgi:4-hydroxy-2-oxovalerate aldolase
MKKKKPIILDVTIRDGSYVNNFQFTVEDVRKIISGLEEAGIDLIEVGHGVGLGAAEAGYGLAAATDEEYLSIASETAQKAKLVTMILPGIGDIRLMELAAKYGMYLIRIAPNVTEVDSARPYVEEAKKLGLKTSINLLKTYLVSTQEMVDIAKKAEDFGADIIYLVDSAGGMTPEDTKERVKALVSALSIPVGFHGHNNISLAQANAITAVRAGATYIDTSLCGMGRSGGNVQTEVFAGFLLQERYPLNIDLLKLLEVADKIVKPLMPYQQGIDAEDFLYGYAQLHSSFEKLIKRFSKKYNLDPHKLILELGKSKIVTPVENEVHNVVKEFIKKEKAYYSYKPRTWIAREAERQAFEIIARAGQNKKTAFIITSFPSPQDATGIAKFSPIRECTSVVYGNVQIARIEDAEEVVMAIDGLVEAIIVDSEVKLDTLSDLVDTVKNMCKRSNFFTYKDIDVWAEAIEALISNLFPSLLYKTVLILGNGSLSYKLSIRLAEHGAYVYLNLKNREVIDGLNLLAVNKRKEIVSIQNIWSICNTVDVLIGCDIITHCIDKKLVQRLKREAVIIDAGRGTLTPDAISIAKKKGIEVFGFDMRLGFAGLISRLLETDEFLKKTRGELIIDGIKIVAGGVLGKKGDVVVDSISNPTVVIGIADGTGKILSDDSKYQNKIQKVKEKLFLLKGGCPPDCVNCGSH